MAEPYVPIAQFTTYNNILTSIEVTTDAAESNADDLDTAVNNALAHKQTAENLLVEKFELFFLAGA
jgi:hypothetical protein